MEGEGRRPTVVNVERDLNSGLSSCTTRLIIAFPRSMPCHESTNQRINGGRIHLQRRGEGRNRGGQPPTWKPSCVEVME